MERGLCSGRFKIRRLLLQSLFGPLFRAAGAFHIDILGTLGTAREHCRAFLLHHEESGADRNILFLPVGQADPQGAGFEREHERRMVRENFKDTFLAGGDDETDFLPQKKFLQRKDFEREMSSRRP